MATPEQSKKLLRRRTSLSSKKNPYSDRGVEKFSDLLAEIEEKKRLIYSQFNPEEVSVIRFVHARNNKLKPVVVRANSSSKLSPNPNNKEFEPIKMVKMQEIDRKLVLEDQDEEELQLKKPEIVDPVGADDKEERLSSMEVVKERPRRNYKGIGGVILVFLLISVVFGRCLKNYYMVKLQAAVCLRIQNIDSTG